MRDPGEGVRAVRKQKQRRRKFQGEEGASGPKMLLRESEVKGREVLEVKSGEDSGVKGRENSEVKGGEDSEVEGREVKGRRGLRGQGQRSGI